VVGGRRRLRWWSTILFAGATVLGALPASSSASSPASAPAEPPVPFTSWDDFLDQQYLDLLGAQPDIGDRAAAMDALRSGSMTPGQLVATVRTSAENQANVDPVARLYRAFFLRIPDRNGLVHWIAVRRSGRTVGRIADAFAGSSEFTNRYGALANRDFVLLVYANVLRRPPDEGGVAYWTAQLDQRRRTRGSVMTGFSESREFRTKETSEVTASVLPIVLLGRSPSTTEFAASVDRLDAGTGVEAEAAAVLASAEYLRRAQRTRLVVFGDSIPDSLINNGSAKTDLSDYDLVNGTVPACDGVDHPPPARIRDGTIHFMTDECAVGWTVQYPRHLVFHADRILIATGVNAMLDHKIDGVWRHPCHAAARDWYRSDLARRLSYLHTKGTRVVLALPPWPGENSGWIMPVDMVKRADCVRSVMSQAAKQTQTAVIDLGPRLCPQPQACARPYRTLDGIHVDVAKAAEILTWLLAASSPPSSGGDDAGEAGGTAADPAPSGEPSGRPGTPPSPPAPLDPSAGTPPPDYQFTADG
jgi:hypothetical protein